MNFVPVFKRFNFSRVLAQLRFLIHEQFNRRMCIIDSFFAIWVPVKGASQNKGVAERRHTDTVQGWRPWQCGFSESGDEDGRRRCFSHCEVKRRVEVYELKVLRKFRRKGLVEKIFRQNPSMDFTVFELSATV